MCSDEQVWVGWASFPGLTSRWRITDERVIGSHGRQRHYMFSQPLTRHPRAAAAHNKVPDTTATTCRLRWSAKARLTGEKQMTAPIDRDRISAPANDARSISAYGRARSSVEGAPLDREELRRMHAY